MSDSLYSSLLSLLPHEYVNGNNSVSDHIEVATKYIKALEKNVKELQEKKDKLEKSLPETSNDGSSSTTTRSTNKSPVSEDFVKIKALSELLEIKIKAVVKEDEVFPLSKVLNVLQEEGLIVVNCGYSKMEHSWVHIIHCEIDDHGKKVDYSRLQRRLTSELSSYAT